MSTWKMFVATLVVAASVCSAANARWFQRACHQGNCQQQQQCSSCNQHEATATTATTEKSDCPNGQCPLHKGEVREKLKAAVQSVTDGRRRLVTKVSRPVAVTKPNQLMISFTNSDQCKDCRALQKNIGSDAVQAKAKSTSTLCMNCDLSTSPLSMFQQYDVSSWPTTVLATIDPTGNLVIERQFHGAMSPAELVDFLDPPRADEPTIAVNSGS